VYKGKAGQRVSPAPLRVFRILSWCIKCSRVQVCFVMAKAATSRLMMHQHLERKGKRKNTPFPGPFSGAAPSNHSLFPTRWHPLPQHHVAPISGRLARRGQMDGPRPTNMDHFSPISSATLRRLKLTCVSLLARFLQ
jgi:hypothetical protein